MKVAAIIFFLVYVYTGLLVANCLILGYAVVTSYPPEGVYDYLSICTAGMLSGTTVYILVKAVKILRATLQKHFNVEEGLEREAIHVFIISFVVSLATGLVGSKAFDGSVGSSVLVNILLQVPLWISLFLSFLRHDRFLDESSR